MYCALQVGCQSALPVTLHKTILPGPMWSIFNTQYAFSYCVVSSLHTLCSLQPDNQPAKHYRQGFTGAPLHTYDKPALLNPDIPTFQCCQPGFRALLIRLVASGSVCVWRALISTVGSCVVDPGVWCALAKHLPATMLPASKHFPSSFELCVAVCYCC